MSWPSFVVMVILVVLLNTIKILREWERGVVLRLGQFQAVRGPGIIFVIPLIERMVRIDTRPLALDVESQDIVTQDNIRLRVNASVRFRIIRPKEAVVNVEDFRTDFGDTEFFQPCSVHFNIGFRGVFVFKQVDTAGAGVSRQREVVGCPKDIIVAGEFQRHRNRRQAGFAGILVRIAVDIQRIDRIGPWISWVGNVHRHRGRV